MCNLDGNKATYQSKLVHFAHVCKFEIQYFCNWAAHSYEFTLRKKAETNVQ